MINRISKSLLGPIRVGLGKWDGCCYHERTGNMIRALVQLDLKMRYASYQFYCAKNELRQASAKGNISEFPEMTMSTKDGKTDGEIVKNKGSCRGLGNNGSHRWIYNFCLVEMLQLQGRSSNPLNISGLRLKNQILERDMKWPALSPMQPLMAQDDGNPGPLIKVLSDVTVGDRIILQIRERA